MINIPQSVRNLGSTIQGYLLPIFVGPWVDDELDIQFNATGFVLRQGTSFFLVTAAHVHAKAKEYDPMGYVAIGNHRLALKRRNMGATLRINALLLSTGC